MSPVYLQIFEDNISYFIVSTVTTDGLALLGSSISAADIVMGKFEAHEYVYDWHLTG